MSMPSFWFLTSLYLPFLCFLGVVAHSMLLRYDKVDKHAIKAGKQVREIKIDDALRSLADSMVKEGQLQPVGLLEDMTLIWGFRRHAGAMLTPEITHVSAAIFSQEVSEQQFLVM